MNENEVVVREFKCIYDFLRVNDFLCDTYQLYNGLQNWDIARWTFNRYCVHGKEEMEDKRIWEESVKLWETVDGDIVGVAHIEEPGEYFFQVHPDYKYLEEEMIEWVLGVNTGKVILHAKKVISIG